MESEDVQAEATAIVLSPLEARVLGCLMEKEATTPDIYPLSLNALVNACNQKNNRAPVMSADEDSVRAAIELLRDKHLLTLFSGAGARAVKYRHKFAEVWPVEPTGQSLMCELLLRGGQTAAGLRGNCERLAAMPDLAEVEAVLGDLAARGLVVRQERQLGQKEGRWAAGIVEMDTAETAATDAPQVGGMAAKPTVGVAIKLPPEAEARIAALETDVAFLKGELARLREALGG